MSDAEWVHVYEKYVLRDDGGAELVVALDPWFRNVISRTSFDVCPFAFLGAKPTYVMREVWRPLLD